MPKAGAVVVRAVEFDVHEVPLPRLLIALPGPAAIRIPVPIGPGRSAGDAVRREGVGVRGEHRAHLRTRRRFEILSATSRPSSTSGASAPSRSGRRSPTISRNAAEPVWKAIADDLEERAPDVAELRTNSTWHADEDDDPLFDSLRWTPIVGQPEPLVKVYPRGFRCRLRSPLRRWLLYLQNPFDQSFCSRWCLWGCGRRRGFPRFPSWLGKRGKRRRSAAPIVHISTGLRRKFGA